ncbi:hypothetical protein HN766_06510 [Candidatus Poribacteria bacterium]|nr:hypothetical protein [Candidatus Poribacteria bacterium]
MQLTPAQKRFFHEEGYVKIPGAVPRVMVDAALHAINHSLGYEGMNKDDLPTMRARSYCTEVRGSDVMAGLFNDTPVFSAAESMLGAGNVGKAGAAQIALRFPGALWQTPGPPGGHLDGLGSGTNGIEKGVYTRGFTGLAVVLLSPLTEPYSGNFTVWPRSHTFYEGYFREHGHAMLADGMPPEHPPGEPVHLTGDPGDVVIAHHALKHSAAPNASHSIRYAAIFRFRHKDCGENGLDGYLDIWREWPGVREVVEAG